MNDTEDGGDQQEYEHWQAVYEKDEQPGDEQPGVLLHIEVNLLLNSFCWYRLDAVVIQDHWQDPDEADERYGVGQAVMRVVRDGGGTGGTAGNLTTICNDDQCE